MNNPSRATPALLLLFLLSSQACADPAPRAEAGAHGLDASALGPEARGRMAEALVTRWRHYVERTYGIPADTWAERMAPALALADATNLREAMSRDTFEGAMAAAGGAGMRLSDAKAIDALAAADDDAGTLALGSLAQDLVYTPIQPCRIIDTRNTGFGAIAANTSRSFIAISVPNYSNQGGSSTNCGIQGVSATAVAIHLTAVAPAGAGFATVYPHGTPQPLAASLNYAGGDIVNNAVIVKIPNPLSSNDMTIYSFAASDFVADIVGYFAPPASTALQCISTSTLWRRIFPLETYPIDGPACFAGYTQVSVYCDSDSPDVRLIGQRQATRTCTFRNVSASVDGDVRATTTCCRVPGR
ncbi:MAG: hypothetical protein U1E24_15615 [Phenylobacterium sp.]|nr:hypothetical protein [Phenylobacterium sp.]